MPRVLVVDDDPNGRYYGETLLRAQGYEVATASNGGEALERARASPPDLVITDILMPDMDGFSLCRRWVADERLSTIPLIFYTATYVDDSDESFALSLGARRFIRKPSEPDSILDAVAEVLGASDSQEVRAAPQAPGGEDEDFLRRYNQVLVHKLEQKVQGLESTRRELARRLQELAENEEKLRRIQRMEAVGRVAAGVAHDFNNLLTVIIGATELADGKCAAGAPVQAELDQIRQAGQRAARLVRQLLAVGSEQVLAPRNCDLREVVTGLRDLLERSLGKNMRLVIRMPDARCGGVVDVGQLEQVLLNLAINAREAMSAGGQLTIEMATVKLDAKRAQSLDLSPGSYACITVRDTGAGMDGETLRRIFDPFFSTKRNGQGSGLGLSTAYGIIRQSGGAIAVQSAPGRGARFDIYLPEGSGSAARRERNVI